MIHRFLTTAAILVAAGALVAPDANAQCSAPKSAASASTADATIASASTADATTASAPATDADLQKAADYILKMAEGGLQVKVVGGYVTFETGSGEIFNAAAISKAAGVSVTDEEMRTVLDLVSAAAGGGASCAPTQTASRGSSCTTGNLCSDLGACSYYGDLAGAQGEKLQEYLAQKSQDGRVYENFDLPVFQARTVAGETVSSASLKGKPTLLALLAPHCGHSIRSLSTLKRLNRRYAPKGVNVVGVFVNTNSIVSAKSRAEQLDLNYPLWTYASDDLGDLLESHLAPTTLLVNADGTVQEKFVGEKSERELMRRLDLLLENQPVQLGLVD